MRAGKVELQWVRPAQQERARDTQDRFVAAATRLLAKGHSFDDISVAALAKTARASVGAFYNRFPDKQALLHVLQIALYREGEETARTALVPDRWAGVSLPDFVRAFVSLAVSSYREQRGLRRALLLAMSEDKLFRDRAVALTSTTCDLLAAVMIANAPKRRKSVAHREAAIRTAVDVCHRMVYGVLDQSLVFERSPTGRELDDAALAGELAEACLAYLSVRLDGTRRAAS